MLQSSHEVSGSSRENQAPRDDDRRVNAAAASITLLTVALGEEGVVHKVIRTGADGRLCADEEQPWPTWFRAQCVPIGSFAQLESILEIVQRRGDTIAVRGTYRGTRARGRVPGSGVGAVGK
jgi:hypothetical protein